MVNIQLSTGLLDVEEGTSFPLNFSVAEIRDISARSGSFSKSITLTGSDNNLNLLGHLYNINVDNGTFDINVLTECQVIQNGLTILSNGYLQLISVNKIEASAVNEEKITFTVLVKDTKASFFTDIDNKYLTDLDLSDLNHNYNASHVVSTFSNTVADGYKYPLMYAPTSTIPLKEFRPAIYAKTYFDRIFATAGKSYTWSTIQECRFDKLLIPYNGTTSLIDANGYKVKFTKAITNTGAYSTTGSNSNINNLSSVTEVIDNNNNFNPTTGIYTSPIYISSGESMSVDISATIELVLNNTAATSVRPKRLFNGVWQNATINYIFFVRAYRNNQQIGATLYLKQFAQNQPLNAGNNTVINESVVGNLSLTGINSGDSIRYVLFVQALQNAPNTTYRTNTNALATVNYTSDVDLTVDQQPSINNAGIYADVDMNKAIPAQIKQKDFVKSIFMMYNLYAEDDTTQPDNIILKHRDDYYDSGSAVDWSKKIDAGKDKTIMFLPDLSAKKMQLSYKDDSDDVNKYYLSGTNETFGQIEYTFDNEYVKGVDRKELIFSPTPSAETSFGAFVPMITGSDPKTNIRILIDNGEVALPTPITIQNTSTDTVTATTYAQLSHFENPENPIFDINFGICDYYLYPIVAPTANNLYNLYYRRTMAQLNSGKMLTAYFLLNEADIQRLRLNDKIYTEGAWWHINKVIDYNANERTVTKVELISADLGLNLPPFLTRPIKPSRVFDLTPIKDVYIRRFLENNNVNKGGVVVVGTGGIVESGEGVFKSINTESINGYSLSNYPKFKAVVSHSGTNDQAIDKILVNDLDLNIECSRDAAGEYRFTGFTTDAFASVLSTEDDWVLLTEDEFAIALESDSTELLIGTLLEADHTETLPNGNTARFYIDGNDIVMQTFDASGAQIDDALPTDSPYIVTFTFWEK